MAIRSDIECYRMNMHAEEASASQTRYNHETALSSLLALVKTSIDVVKHVPLQ